MAQLKIWDQGSGSWKYVSQGIEGPAGAAGATGATGPEGYGVTGATGPQGATGPGVGGIDRIALTIGDGSNTITSGIVTWIEVPFNCTLLKNTMLADQTGSIVLDIWKDVYNNFPPTVADTITASAKPTISSGIKSKDETLTGWTTSITSGDILLFKVDSCSDIKKLVFVLTLEKT